MSRTDKDVPWAVYRNRMAEEHGSYACDHRPQVLGRAVTRPRRVVIGQGQTFLRTVHRSFVREHSEIWTGDPYAYPALPEPRTQFEWVLPGHIFASYAVRWPDQYVQLVVRKPEVRMETRTIGYFADHCTAGVPVSRGYDRGYVNGVEVFLPCTPDIPARIPQYLGSSGDWAQADRRAFWGAMRAGERQGLGQLCRAWNADPDLGEDCWDDWGEAVPRVARDRW